MNDTIMEERLLSEYEIGGQYGVYEWVENNHPDWEWSLCEPCEDETPTWDTEGNHLCAVCFTPKGETK